MGRKGILDLLRERPVVGDGSYVFTLEKRGYVKAGLWTPECVVEHPEAVKQLHREFLRAGSDVIQAFTFYTTDGILTTSGVGQLYKSEDLNQAACDIAWEVARANGDHTLVCGGISPTPTYTDGKGKAAVQAEFRKQTTVLTANKVDFLLAEFFAYVEEAVWAIEVLKEVGLPVACTLKIGPLGDINDVSPGDCALKMAKAGADIVGLNCTWDPFVSLKTMKQMKTALDADGLTPFLMMQPLGWMCPETENLKYGYLEIPEMPFAMEPRLLTRWDARKFARMAYDLGVRYIGGCCGWEPHHIREAAEELAEERGGRPPGADKNGIWGADIKQGVSKFMKNRCGGKEYWSNLKPGCGRSGHSAESGAE